MPAQVQLQGVPFWPPEMAEVVPALHRLPEGAAGVATPLIAGSHCPSVGVVAKGSEHEAVVPLPVPTQLHVHGGAVPSTLTGAPPLTAVAVPALHNSPVGAVALGVDVVALLHCPLTDPTAEQEALWLLGPLPP